MNAVAHTIASVGRIARLGCGPKGRPMEINRTRDRLRPEGNYSHGKVDLSAVGAELNRSIAYASEIITRNSQLFHHSVQGRPGQPEASRGSANYAAGLPEDVQDVITFHVLKRGTGSGFPFRGTQFSAKLAPR